MCFIFLCIHIIYLFSCRKRNNEDKKKHNSSGDSFSIKEESSRRSSRQSENSVHKHSHDSKKVHETKAHRKKNHDDTKSHTSSKSCDKKEEKSKNKRKTSSNSSDLDKNNEDEKLVLSLSSDKASTKANIEFSLPMVVVEKIDFSLQNLEKSKLDLHETENANFKENSEGVDDGNDEIGSNEMLNDIVQNKLENIDAALNGPPVEKVKTKHRRKHKNHSHSNSDVQEIKHKQLILDGEPAKSRHKQEKERGRKKVKHHDIRKAPQLDMNASVKSESVSDQSQPAPVVPIVTPIVAPEPVVEEIKTEHQRVAIKIKLCNTCNTRHLQDTCPLRNPHNIIHDAITLENWKSNPDNLKRSMNTESSENESMDKNDDSTSAELSQSYAENSLPNILYLEQTDSTHGLSVFAKCDIKEYSQFGPLIGNIVKEVDISEDSSMQHIWEVR